MRLSQWHWLAPLLALTAVALHPAACGADADAPNRDGVGQARWRLIYSSTDPEMYRGISFPDATNGWTVGDSGKILHSTDAGRSWQLQTSPVGNRLTCVQFVNPQIGWTAGESNFVLRTKDGGRSWVADHPPGGPPQRTFMGLQFFNEQDGWIIHNYGGLLHTRDGGRTWLTHESLARHALIALHFLDAKRGWVLSVGGTLLQTVDGGQHWSSKKLSAQPHAVASFTALSFLDATNGWIGTDTAISSRWEDVPPLFRTTDGGRTWSIEGHWPGESVRSIWFRNTRLGWCAEFERIYSTQDGGSTWVQELNTGGDPFVQMIFLDASRAWALTVTGNVFAYSEPDR
ncbi:MAG: WD40/YVTN/BNR-like repeat-containing protein [Verrucomicrobiia bacterium]